MGHFMDVEQVSLVVIQSSLSLLLTVFKDLIGCFSFIDSRISQIFLYQRQLNGKKVACGAWKLDSVDTNEESLEITEIINHPEYNPSTSENDIAVLKVSRTFTCEQGKIWPACLPNEEVSYILSNTIYRCFVNPGSYSSLLKPLNSALKDSIKKGAPPLPPIF